MAWNSIIGTPLKTTHFTTAVIPSTTAKPLHRNVHLVICAASSAFRSAAALASHQTTLREKSRRALFKVVVSLCHRAAVSGGTMPPANPRRRDHPRFRHRCRHSNTKSGFHSHCKPHKKLTLCRRRQTKCDMYSVSPNDILSRLRHIQSGRVGKKKWLRDRPKLQREESGLKSWIFSSNFGGHLKWWNKKMNVATYRDVWVITVFAKLMPIKRPRIYFLRQGQ